MPIYTKQAGAWKAYNQHSRHSGAYKKHTDGWVKVSGVWKRIYQAADPLTLNGIITLANLRSGLQFCLDAADGGSYAGSGQQWSDLSGLGTHVYRGASGSSESSDPTFNGVADSKSKNEYWSTDGGDYFQNVSALPAGVKNWHKAGAKGTIVYVGQPVFPYLTEDNFHVLVDTRDGSYLHGVALYFYTQTFAWNAGDEKLPDWRYWDERRLRLQIIGASGQVTDRCLVGIKTDDASNLSDFGVAWPTDPGAEWFISVSWDMASDTSLSFVVNDRSYSGGDPATHTPGANDGAKLALANFGMSGALIHATAGWDANLSLANQKTLQSTFKAARSYGWPNA